MTSFNLNYFLTSNTATLEIRASTCEFGGETYIQSIYFIRRDIKDACTERKDHVRHREKAAICQPRDGASGETNPDGTWILDFQPPEL